MSRLETIKGFFGQFIHYKDGVRVGESWPGMIDGSYNHYDQSGNYAGYSDPGFFAEQAHHNAQGGYVGETWTDDFDVSRHYDDRGPAGESFQDSFGVTHTFMFDDVDRDAELFNEPTDFDL